MSSLLLAYYLAYFLAYFLTYYLITRAPKINILKKQTSHM
ncbi:hypothetical protein BRYFOR_08865 [Marvinbryantia formatexigens DSM 14469]|uniref:Uncharacterized protein n=1 Tax=Marvinbryantia formatexigens DSM 14469 TaxID=478749 RepID=C6LJM7_9FIRM|nr:hypothetical protein BRYFOR_08865 [Marvinbryantia formatexigens DSM 14469]